MSDLPHGWADVVLEDVVFDIVGGGTPSKANESYFRGAIPFMTVKDMNVRFPSDTQDKITQEALEKSSARMIPAGTNIIATRMGLGKAVRPSIDVAINQDLKAIFPTEALHDDFLNWKLIQSSDYFLNLGTGTTVKGVRLEDVRALPIELPPLPEQRRIVAKVDGLTARTARARKELDCIPTLIARYKQRLLALAFSGELTAGWRNERNLAGPKLKAFQDVIDEGPTNGWSPPSLANSAGALSLKLTATTSGKLRLDDAAVKRITATPPDNSKFWLVPGDMLIQRANSLEYVGATAIYDGPEKTYIYPDLMMKVRVGDPLTRTYLWRFLNSDVARGYFKANATGTAGNMPKINGKVLKATPVPIFTKEEQAEIVRRIESAFGWLDRVAANHAAAARLLPKLDTAILAKAFCGELVPQDPDDEPASVLLERIKAEREAASDKPKRGRGRPRVHQSQSDGITTGSPVLDQPTLTTSRRPSVPKSRHDDDVWQKPYLTGLLKQSKSATSPEELFSRSGLQLADFYHQLSTEYEDGWLVEVDGQVMAA